LLPFFTFHFSLFTFSFLLFTFYFLLFTFNLKGVTLNQHSYKGGKMVFFRFITVGLLILSIAACGDKEQNKTATVETDTQKQAIKTETSSDMPELWEFHEVIYQIWHEAWPEKNTVMLKDLIPEIEAGFAKLEQASLPGILRDKQEAWTKGIQDMAGIIETYKKTAVADEKEALLKAAEDLHSQFELLVRL
jgi:predicted small lipoprotein YifL